MTLVLILVFGTLIFVWLKRRSKVRTNDVNSPRIMNGVKNNFGARRNYM